MKSREVLETLSSIVEKAGLTDMISIGCDKNEVADIMWFSSNEKEDYLAVYEKPLFPFSCIENITYEYEKEGDNRLIAFKYADDLCILKFHLKGNCRFIIECDEDCMLNLYFNNFPGDNRKWTDSMTDFNSAVSKYTLQMEKQEVYESLVYSLFDSLENQPLDTDLCEKQHRIIFDYLISNKNDDQMLFLYAYEAANYISLDYKDYPYFNDIISEVKERGLNDELLVYVRKRCLKYNWDDNDRYVFNMTFQDITEKILNQLNADNTDLKSQ